MNFFIFLPLRWYKKIFSPDHGIFSFFFPYGFCKFYPSCSQYTHRSLIKYGVIKGILMGIYRIFRCHPWSRGGIDHP